MILLNTGDLPESFVMSFRTPHDQRFDYDSLSACCVTQHVKLPFKNYEGQIIDFGIGIGALVMYAGADGFRL